MRRWIVGAAVAAAVLFFGGRSYISGHGRAYVQEVLDAYARMQRGAGRPELVSFDGGWGGAEAVVRFAIPPSGGGFPAGVTSPVTLKLSVGYGPFFFREMMPGLIRIESRGSLSAWLDEKTRRRFLQTVPKDIGYDYRGVMDWWHVMHEHITLSRLEASDRKRRRRWRLEPTEIRSDFVLASLKGRAEFFNGRLTLLGEGSAETLELENLRLDAVVDEFNATGPIFGEMALSAGEIRMVTKKPRARRLRFSAGLGIALKRQSEGLATLEIDGKGKALSPQTRKEWKGLEAVQLRLSVDSLGIEGIGKLAAMQRERQKIRQELTRAVGAGDDPAMQKAILALQALDDGWIEAYNTLFVPGKTRLLLDERLHGEKESRLFLDLRFTGKKLPKDPFGAMVALTTNLHRLVEGSFELEMEQKLIRQLSPEGAMILDSMVRKGLATLNEGIYRLKGSIEKGRIVINGTRYAPRELIMMILI